MTMVPAFFTWAIFLASLVVTILAQPPAQGIQLGDPEHFWDDFRFPLAVSQCEPILIWYNRTELSRNSAMFLTTPNMNESDVGHGLFLQILAPFGSGYIEWVCNIPANYSFIVGYRFQHYIVVRPGTSSSSCLRNVTAAYEYAMYFTSSFQPYTAQPPNTTRPIIRSDLLAKYVNFRPYSSPKLTIP
jgi:hypothetical protein